MTATESKQRPAATLDERQRQYLFELLDTPGPSGFEDPATEVFCGYGEDFGETRMDALGNGYITVNAGCGGPRVSLVGHIDEIGFIVTRVMDEGFLRFSSIGGWDATVPVGQRVRVVGRDGVVPGTVGRKAIHQIPNADRSKAAQLKDLWIDVGARDGDEARAMVRPGDPVVLDSTPHLYDNGLLMSRALDDRIGVYVVSEVARRCAGAPVEVVVVATVGEENTLLGAGPSAYSLQPDVCCVVDVTFTSDVPDDEGSEDVRLGGGPVVGFGAASRSRVGRELLEVASGLDMTVQLSGSGRHTGTDAEAVAAAGAGVVVGNVFLPCRYLHTPGELVDLADIEDAITLLEAWVRSQAR